MLRRNVLKGVGLAVLLAAGPEAALAQDKIKIGLVLPMTGPFGPNTGHQINNAIKVYMAQQTGVNPPSFVFHVNDVKLVHFGYERYMENRIRDDFGYLGTPLRLMFRGHKEE